MFAKPENGWVMIQFNGIDFMSASYITDVPFDTINELIISLKDPSHKLNLAFDNEPAIFGLIEFAEEIFCVKYGANGCEMNPFDKCFNVPFDFSDNTILVIAKEVAEDIEKYFTEWIYWQESREEMSKSEAYTRERALKRKLKELRETIESADTCPYKNMEIGNMLFGNSRGQYSIDRDEQQDIFCKFLEDNHFDFYGYADTKWFSPNSITERGGFENDVFLINPYYWGDNEDIAAESNFIFKPTGLEIQWYKYPLRDAYSNKVINKNDLREILNNCQKSLNVPYV